MKKLIFVLCIIFLISCSENATDSTVDCRAKLPGTWTLKWHFNDGDVTFIDTIKVNGNTVRLKMPIGISADISGQFSGNKFEGAYYSVSVLLTMDSEKQFSIKWDAGISGIRYGDATKIE